ncbi:uncharacterized protein LOC143146523 [Ptiloglossa arizonensis]|uniref:uncharacterized protein LOC143146523 n=1 Tax=Ptiloglossa arizonensis TaxID=3350558 RepID=UPI003FA06062
MYKYFKLLDPVVICPYDKNHLIARSRIQKHIVKCEKQYPEHYKVLCPYNATHRLFKHELEEHIITCPARSVLDYEMYSERREHGSTSFSLQTEISSTVDCTENWDLESNDNSRFLTYKESDLEDNIEMYKEDLDSNLNKNIIENKNLRAPRGFSEAMMREENEESDIEDSESIMSSMGIGRGKITKEKMQAKLIALGRGGRLPNAD